MDFHFLTYSLAPSARLTPAGSHVVVDLIFGGWLLAVAAAIGAFAWFARQRALRLGAEVWKKRGLAAGPILLPGRAELTQEDKDAAQPRRACVELTIIQKGTQHRSKHGYYVRWVESERTLDERPFILVTDGGERVRIEPSSAVELVDALEPPVKRTRDTRHKQARITPGEKIWVRGQLVSASQGAAAGPYRGGGPAQWVLRPPKGAPMLISSEPMEKEGLADARFHLTFSILFLVLLVICQAALFSTYRALRSHGVEGTAEVTYRRSWITRSKNSTTHHYAFKLRYEVDGQRFDREQETNSTAYNRVKDHASVPIVYLPSDPAILLLGPTSEVGTSGGFVAGASVMSIVLGVLYVLMLFTRRPWWRKRQLVDQENGQL